MADGVADELRRVAGAELLEDVGAVVLANFLSIALFYFWIPAVYSARMIGLKSPFALAGSWLGPSALFLGVTALLMLLG